jgi:hypothetical protein
MNNISIDQSLKLRLLEEILASEEFIQAQKHQDLLRYLVHASTKGEIVKEATIAMEFFGRNAAFDPAIDSTVRAYMSNLRKKLEHYYLTEGKEKDIKLILPKGHYGVEFIQCNNLRKNQLRPSNKLPHLIYLAFIFILITIIIFLGRDRIFQKHPPYYISTDNPIWKDLLSNNQKTLIVLGDYFVFSMPFDTARHSYIRDIEINSEQDLEAFISEHPSYQNKIAQTYHTYLEEHIPWCLSFILPSFIIHKKVVELKLASEVQLEDLQKYNIIYIGPYKSLNLLKTVTRSLHFIYTPRKSTSTLTYVLHDSNQVFTYSWMTNPETNARNDYAMVVKVSGHNKNTFLFFLSQHDFGNIATVKYFTNPIHLKELESLLTSNYFEALFEVKGIIRTDFEIKLLHINQLHSDFEIKLE